MLRRLFLFVLFIFCVESSDAQQFNRYVHSAQMVSRINPASIGFGSGYLIDGITKFQRLSNSTPIQFNSISVQKMIAHNSMGIGFVYNGFNNNGYSFQNFNGVYNYRIRVNGGTFGLGANLGMKQVQLNFNGLDPSDADDPLLTAGSELVADFGLGVYYKTDKLKLGLSSLQLFPQVSFEFFEQNLSSNHFYAIGSYKIDLSRNFELNNNLVLRYVKNVPVNGDVNVSLNCFEKLLVGVNYNTSKSFGILFDVSLHKIASSYSLPIKLGYAHEFNVNSAYSSIGSANEIFIQLLIDPLPNPNKVGKKKQIENPADFNQ